MMKDKVTIFKSLLNDKKVRRIFDDKSSIYMERLLPFITVFHDFPKKSQGLSKLIAGCPSRFVCRKKSPSHNQLIETIALDLAEHFGKSLVLTVKLAKKIDSEPSLTNNPVANFKVITSRNSVNIGELFVQTLCQIDVNGTSSQVKSRHSKTNKNLEHTEEGNKSTQIHHICIEVSPFFINSENGEIFPKLFRTFCENFNRALQKAFYLFTCRFTTHNPSNYHVLSRRALCKSVVKVDDILSTVSDNLELLLQVTPTNADQAWLKFKHTGFKNTPEFHYRPIPVDPLISKRVIYKAPVEQIKDPVIADIYRQKINELDRQITLLQDRGNGNFLHESIQIFGTPEESLVTLSKNILNTRPRIKQSQSGVISAREFAILAKKEIEKYTSEVGMQPSKVMIRKDMSGIMVSNGKLLINSSLKIPKWRADALLQHEVGTHILTWLNGSQQPLKIFRCGLADYEGFQEGLAVLNEYLCGGLTLTRLKLLAARVMATKYRIDGANFIECFETLKTKFEFNSKIAFQVTSRIYRSGGYVKDATYLKGFVEVINYLQTGGDISPLYVGKISCNDIPVMKELLSRQILKQPMAIPSIIKKQSEKINQIRNGLKVTDLLK